MRRGFLRRRERPDPTLPVDPPEGMKWVISKTVLALDGRPLLELGLWPIGVRVNEWGIGETAKNHTYAEFKDHFEVGKPHRIRRLSEKILREQARELVADASTQELLRRQR